MPATEETRRIEVRLSGFGGQGIILAGNILGKAVALFEGRNAVFTQSYGPEARGGACNADVVISDEPIHYPKVTRPDVLVLMSEDAKTTHGGTAGPDTMVIVDEDLVRTDDLAGSAAMLYAVPATRMAEELGRRMVANIVMLGYLSSVSAVAGYEPLKKAILSAVPKGTEELNSTAFERGFRYGEEAKNRRT
ncbi:MAG: 2-oxoacid:acceptor oxidoreductase family protein [bacterium]